ncbi:MmgE/PrpD family protein [Achromobacter aloeverae]
MKSLSVLAADWYLSLRYGDLPPDIVEETRRAILNTIAVATAASGLAYGPPLRATALDLGGEGPAQLFGWGNKTSRTAAAFVNATLTAALAYDDSHTETLIHVYGTIVSTVLALAQENSIDGKEAIAAIAGASELTCRIGVIAPTAFHRNGLHPTGIVGAFGAAYAAARLLRLNHAQTVHAVGIVGNLASGINQCWVDGTWSQLVDNGWAAQAGITAATLARNGYTGPAEVLEGELGLFRSHIQQTDRRFDFDRMPRDLGRHWEMREIEIKPYPCGHVSQPFVDCALALHRQGLRIQDISAVTCLVADWMVPVVCEPLRRKRRPETAWHGRVSLPYTVAEALWSGRLNAESYRDEYLANPELLALVDRIDYRIDPSVNGGRAYKGWVQVRTHDGRLLEEIKSGENSDKRMPEAAFLEKIRRCLHTGGMGERYEAILAAVAGLDAAPSVSVLMSACEPARRGQEGR